MLGIDSNCLNDSSQHQVCYNVTVCLSCSGMLNVQAYLVAAELPSPTWHGPKESAFLQWYECETVSYSRTLIL